MSIYSDVKLNVSMGIKLGISQISLLAQVKVNSLVSSGLI